MHPQVSLPYAPPPKKNKIKSYISYIYLFKNIAYCVLATFSDYKCISIGMFNAHLKEKFVLAILCKLRNPKQLAVLFLFFQIRVNVQNTMEESLPN